MSIRSLPLPSNLSPPPQFRDVRRPRQILIHPTFEPSPEFLQVTFLSGSRNGQIVSWTPCLEFASSSAGAFAPGWWSFFCGCSRRSVHAAVSRANLDEWPKPAWKGGHQLIIAGSALTFIFYWLIDSRSCRQTSSRSSRNLRILIRRSCNSGTRVRAIYSPCSHTLAPPPRQLPNHVHTSQPARLEEVSC